MKNLLSLSLLMSSLLMISSVYYDPCTAFPGENGILPGTVPGKRYQVVAADRNKHCRQKQMILSEFDGTCEPGQWDIHQYNGKFSYTASRDALIMDGSGGLNQHITRRGILIDPVRPYAIEADFTINEPDDAAVPNSFCINFNIAGDDGQLDSLNCWSLNLDIGPKGVNPAGVMKTMGFVNGNFDQLRPSHKIDWCEMRTNYHMILKINKDMQDKHAQNIVSVTIYESHKLKDNFETDYSTFPYQVDYNHPVRFGLNTHGANWTVKNLKVYYLD